MADPLLLALGGTRSGKSRFGLRRAIEHAAGAPVWFLATAWPDVDPELDDRIARHRAERPATWPTIEVGTDLAAAVEAVPPDGVLLLDGLTLWISGLLGEGVDDIDPLLAGPVAAGLDALEAHRGAAIVVSDDVGGGIVPMHPVARRYRDLVGIVHQRLAARADEVHLLVAGIPLPVKGPDRR